MMNDVYEQMKCAIYADTHEFETPEDEAEYMRYCEEGKEKEHDNN